MSLDHNQQQISQKQYLPSPRKKSAAPAIFIILSLLIIAAAFIYLYNGSNQEKTYEYVHMLMDTNITLRFESGDFRTARETRDAVFAEMERLEGLLSRSLAGSDVDSVNRQAGVEPVEVSPETHEVARAALEFARLSEGAFDPTVAPLLDLWGFLGQQYHLPGEAEIEAVLPMVDYTLVELDSERGTIYLPEAGMSLDLGGIAKGYIVDRGLAELTRAGVKHAFLNAGGDIGLIGPRLDGSPWRIAVSHPRPEVPNQLIAIIPWGKGGAIVTSGDYERTFEEGGLTYHHILDPETGQPARSLASVTIIAPTAMEADALSTAVFVLGPERGLALVESLPGVEAFLVTAELELLISTGLEDIIELL